MSEKNHGLSDETVAELDRLEAIWVNDRLRDFKGDLLRIRNDYERRGVDPRAVRMLDSAVELCRSAVSLMRGEKYSEEFDWAAEEPRAAIIEMMQDWAAQDNECTDCPVWVIARGRKAQFVQGFWFSRRAATDHLKANRHNFGKLDYVYCRSGAGDLRRLRDLARETDPKPAEAGFVHKFKKGDRVVRGNLEGVFTVVRSDAMVDGSGQFFEMLTLENAVGHGCSFPADGWELASVASLRAIAEGVVGWLEKTLADANPERLNVCFNKFSLIEFKEDLKKRVEEERRS